MGSRRGALPVVSLRRTHEPHPESGIDHFTRSAYEMYYIDSDHPLAPTPPEWRDKTQEAFSGKRKTRRNH